MNTRATTAAAAICVPGGVVVLTKREELRKRVAALDEALAQHARLAVEQQSQWRDKLASLDRERNDVLRQLSEL